MQTKVFTVSSGCTDWYFLTECAKMLAEGKTVAFPTETVYGLGADALNKCAVESIYAAKNRPPQKPLSVCVSDVDMADTIAFVNDDARLLFDKLLPGPLTLVLPKRNVISDIVTAGLSTVGVRVPSNFIAQELVKISQKPLALPSANLSGQGALCKGEDVVRALLGKVDAIIDAGETSLKTESTIISLVDKPKILRLGAVSTDVISAVLGKEVLSCT